MTPEERQLVTGLFDRMRGFGSPEKDRDAEAMINQAVRAMPDAPYMLVQSVLAQEHALQEAGRRIEDLEAQVRSLQGEGPPRSPAGSGSFLGGLLGGGRPAAQSQTSVPPIGSRAVPSGVDERPGWGGQPPPMQAAPGGGGGFLRSAMTTAAGVAGGMLAAGAISNMLGGRSTAGSGGSGSEVPRQARSRRRLPNSRPSRRGRSSRRTMTPPSRMPPTRRIPIGTTEATSAIWTSRVLGDV